MKVTYETCGQLDLTNFTAKAFTYLPKVDGAAYKYIEFYNISNDDEFGVFGVMVDNLGNEDLHRRVEPLTAVAFQPFLDLEFINSKFARRYLTDLTEDDKVNFFCWHDNAFDTKILQWFKDQKLTMAEILEQVRAGLPEFKDNDETETFYLKQPKRGEGGILTVDGTC